MRRRGRPAHAWGGESAPARRDELSAHPSIARLPSRGVRTGERGWCGEGEVTPTHGDHMGTHRDKGPGGAMRLPDALFGVPGKLPYAFIPTARTLLFRHGVAFAAPGSSSMQGLPDRVDTGDLSTIRCSPPRTETDRRVCATLAGRSGSAPSCAPASDHAGVSLIHCVIAGMPD